MKKPSNQNNDNLRSFLQSSPQEESSVIGDSSRQASSFIQSPSGEDNPRMCGTCGIELMGAKIKMCGHCDLPSCGDHLRKRRPKNKKWQWICDCCEDRVLYQTYMKLESKAEEALITQNEIVTMKHASFLEEVEDRRAKRKEASLKVSEVRKSCAERMTHIVTEEEKLKTAQQLLAQQHEYNDQLEQYIVVKGAELKSDLFADYQILDSQSERITKQLSRIEKKLQEIRFAVQKREDQIQKAYDAWQRRQFDKQASAQVQSVNRAPPKKDCVIF